jgi:hypothetical protein
METSDVETNNNVGTRRLLNSMASFTAAAAAAVFGIMMLSSSATALLLSFPYRRSQTSCKVSPNQNVLITSQPQTRANLFRI